ncbi:MAG: hypothetical protein HQM12_16335 [SAR324 cluster bacterium]|nr:hypothetical protein [SAR324 cluster bacterium]
MNQIQIAKHIALITDGQYKREYDRTDASLRARDTTLSLTRQYEQGSASLMFNPYSLFEAESWENRKLQDSALQQLPQFTFNVSGNPWDELSLTLETSGSSTRYYREIGRGGVRTIATPKIRYQFPFFEYFKANLGYGKRFSFYDVDHPQSSFAIDIEVLDAEINTALERIFEVDDGNYSRFKHIITPRILYTQVADVHQEQSIAVSFDGEDSVKSQQLITFRIDNVLLAKKRLIERAITLNESGYLQLRKFNLKPQMLHRIRPLVGQEFSAEIEFLTELDRITDGELSEAQKEDILAVAQRGVLRSILHKTGHATYESPSWVFATFSLAQRYDKLKEDIHQTFRGPVELNSETDPGEPLLPLILEWGLNPGPAFSWNFMLRYHHQLSRIIESKADFQVSIDRNTSNINFHNNENTFRTTDGFLHQNTSTLSFNNSFAATDELSVGFYGKLNLSADDRSFERRLVEDSFSTTYRSNCYALQLSLRENVTKVQDDAPEGVTPKEREVVDRTVYFTVTFGPSDLPTIQANETYIREHPPL